MSNKKFLFGKFYNDLSIEEMNLIYEKHDNCEITMNTFMSEVYIDNEDTIKIMWNTYKKNINYLEIAKNKGLVSFSQDELSELILGISSNSVTTKERVWYLVQNYMLWCMSKDMISINPLAGLDKEELCKVNIKGLQSQFITIKKLSDECHKTTINGASIGECLCVLLGRYGVSSGDIIRLKWDDLDRENNLLYIESKEIHIPIDELLIEWIDKAKEETIHNGVELIDTGYIIKPNKNMGDFIVGEDGYYNMVLRFFKSANIKRVSSKSLNNMRAVDFLLEKRKQGRLKSDDIKNIYYSILNPNGSGGSYNTLTRYYTSLTGDEVVLMKNANKFKEDENPKETVAKIKEQLGY